MGTAYIDPATAGALDEAADIADGRDTVDDVQQQAYDGPAIPVRTVDPVEVQPLPTRAGSPQTVACGNTQAQKLCTMDPKRARLTISSDAIVWIGTDQNETTAKTRAFRLPANVPVPFNAQDQWWAMADAGTANVSILTEQWAR